MTKTLIKNAQLVSDGVESEGDLLIEGARIARVDRSIPADGADVIDAAGLALLPGMIDDQVHFREPGITYKGDFYTESRAALAGGITSWMEMPNSKPQTIDLAALEDKFQLASGRAWGNHAFYLGATNDNIEAIRALDPNQTCGIKIFMGASTGNMLVDDHKVLEQIFRDAPTIVVTHCEDTPTILANEVQFRERYGEELPMELHPQIRSEEACYQSSSMAVELAKTCHTRLHVLHLTTAKELSLFKTGPVDGKQITVEACAHHLYFSERDYEEKGGFIKCNPAIKQESDRQALRQALAEDRIDVIATDHAPHTLEEKSTQNYFQCPAGLPLVQHALAMALELVHDGVLSLPHVVEKVCHAPARLFQVVDRGFLREGGYADLVLVDMKASDRVRREDVLYKCGWSPLEGRTLQSKVVSTFVNGVRQYHQGEFFGEPQGMRLAFDR